MKDEAGYDISASGNSGDKANQAVKRSHAIGETTNEGGLLARLERLELAATPIPQFCLQYGWLRKLPPD